MAHVAGKATRMAVPQAFVFKRAVLSHGWFDLPPFAWDEQSSTLSRGLVLASGRTALVRVSGAPGRLRVSLSTEGRRTRSDVSSAVTQVRRMLRLEDQLEEFYRLAERLDRPDLRWVGSAGAGRLLRSPTVFEDLVKMICTTNCTWALTRVMVTGLVGRLGPAAPGGARAFPAPQTMADRPERFYRDVIRAGYRAGAIRQIARAVADSRVRPEAWMDPAMPVEEIRREILALPGAGPYVADNMLKLLGRYDGLGIDAWCRRKFSELHHDGRRVSDRTIARFYEPFGRWRGLALWCDLTKAWIEEEAPLW